PPVARRGPVVADRWTLASGSWTLDAERWPLYAGRWPLDAGRWTLDAGRWTIFGISRLQSSAANVFLLQASSLKLLAPNAASVFYFCSKPQASGFRPQASNINATPAGSAHRPGFHYLPPAAPAPFRCAAPAGYAAAGRFAGSQRLSPDHSAVTPVSPAPATAPGHSDARSAVARQTTAGGWYLRRAGCRTG